MKQKRSAHRNIKYACTACKKEPGRDGLTVKVITFREMGLGGKQIKNRVVAWLCDDCRDLDIEWHLPPMSTSPGFADTPIARPMPNAK